MMYVGKKIIWSRQDLVVLEDMFLSLFKLKLSTNLNQSYCMNCGTLMIARGGFCSIQCKTEYFD